MKIVPFHSQHGEAVPEEWRWRACGIACLKTVIDMYSSVPVAISTLIDEGVREEAYLEGVGWKHDGLVELAKLHGVRASRDEFKGSIQKGIAVIKEHLKNGGFVMASVATEHENQKTFHLVLLIAVDKNGFYYNDSAKKSAEDGQGIYISFKDFQKYWRGLVIFFDK
jgi:hypothetical protein